MNNQQGDQDKTPDKEGGGGWEERQRLEKQKQDSTIDRDKKQGGTAPLKTPPPPD